MKVIDDVLKLGAVWDRRATVAQVSCVQNMLSIFPWTLMVVPNLERSVGRDTIVVGRVDRSRHVPCQQGAVG
jgi:hypothetical protein